jgi:hypothetical protein
MFDFNFSILKIESKNKTSYPVSLADVKEFCEFYKENPTSTKYDSIINSVWIPRFVEDWENTTGFVLLDTSVKSFVRDILDLPDITSFVSFINLNIREVTAVKYHPTSWDNSAAKTTLDTSKYIISEEIGVYAKTLSIKKDFVPFYIYPIKFNLQAEYTCGYEDNDFTNIPVEIKQAIAMQIAMQIDTSEGLVCDEIYAEHISTTYANYTVRKQIITHTL